jgi:hypothetical protein
LALEKPAPNYDELVAGSQNHWEYVNMMLHLMKKNPSEYTGCETFVQACLDAGDLRWVPAKTSYAIQAAGKSYGGAASAAGAGSVKDKKAAQQVALLQGLRDQLAGVRKLVGGAASACGRIEAVLGTQAGEKGAKGEKGKGGDAGDVSGAVGEAVGGAVDGIKKLL